MRKILSVVALAFTATILSVAQQSPPHKTDIDGLLVKLRSNDDGVRAQAYEQLKSDPKVKAALVNRLDRENQETVSDEEEDYADYLGWLVDTVAKVVDWSNPHQVCILANSVYLADELADHAKVAVPCLLQRFKNAPALSRGRVVAMLVQALAKGRNDLDAATIQRVRQIVRSALHDSDVGARIDTVNALAKFGGEDMIPALRVVAEKDPDPSEGYAIRKWAAEAIAAIQKRAGQH